MLLYRVFPSNSRVAPDQPGGALYVPEQLGGRLDNPSLYSVLYLSDSPAGAVAEAFGRFPEWTPAILKGSPSVPDSVRAIAQYDLPDDAPLCDLDDPEQLLRLGMRPSDVVTRNYIRSRAWARRIYEQGRWIGVRWWSYYDPRWASIGLWETSHLTLGRVDLLRLDSPAVVEASRTIVRRILGEPRT